MELLVLKAFHVLIKVLLLFASLMRENVMFRMFMHYIILLWLLGILENIDLICAERYIAIK